MTPTRATLDDDLRERIVRHVMRRDRLGIDAARGIVNRLGVGELTRLELETRDQARPAFTADYDPYARSNS